MTGLLMVSLVKTYLVGNPDKAWWLTLYDWDCLPRALPKVSSSDDAFRISYSKAGKTQGSCLPVRPPCVGLPSIQYTGLQGADESYCIEGLLDETHGGSDIRGSTQGLTVPSVSPCMLGLVPRGGSS